MAALSAIAFFVWRCDNSSLHFIVLCRSSENQIVLSGDCVKVHSQYVIDW